MRIGIDARELEGRSTGVGRYLIEILTRWRARQDHTFLLYRRPPADNDGGPARRIGPNGQFVDVAGSPSVVWEQVALPRRANRDALDVFFAPAYAGPVAVKAPLVVTIHDLSFVARPDWFGWREGLRRRTVCRLSARRARVILTDSAFSRAEIVERLGVPASRVHVVWPGLGSAPETAPDDGAVPGEPLILYVGTILNRRHVPDLIAAFARVARRHHGARLVIVGDNRTHPRQDPAGLAASAGLGDRVTIRAFAPAAEVAALYRRARVFVFLSEYEGFGFTPLEALAAGVPVVVADTPVAREVYGDAAVYVAVGDVPGTATAITRVLEDERTRLGLAGRARAVLARYSWDETAQRTLALIERAARS